MPDLISHHIRRETFVNFVSNMLFNGIIAWLLFKDGGPLNRWGSHSFGVDIIATAFILPFIVALIVIPLQRRKVAKGKLPSLTLDNSVVLHRMFNALSQSLMLSGLFFGLLGLLVFAPVILVPLLILGIEELSPLSYSIFKAVWAGALAATLVYPMILIGLRSPDVDLE